MKLTARRTTLLNAVKTALKAIGSRKDMPEICGLLFEADADRGIVTVTGTDIHTQIQCRLQNEHVFESGAVILRPAIAEILALLPGETVEMGIDMSNRVEIKSEKARYNIAYLDPMKFPKTQIPFPEDFICIKGINGLIRQTSFAAESRVEDVYKRSLQYVRLSFANGNTTAEATNGSIAAISQTPHVSDGSLDLILHKEALRILSSVVSPSEELYAGIAGNFAVFMKEDMFFSSQLFKGSYIEGSKLVDYIKPIYRAVTDAKAIHDAIGSTSNILRTSDDQCINLCIGNDIIAVNAKTAAGTSKAEVLASNTIPTAADGFNYNPKWLLECLKQTSGPLTLSMNENGFMLIEANQSKYCISPRSPVKIREPKPKAEKKTKSKTKAALKTAA